jgi:hypothetical protein
VSVSIFVIPVNDPTCRWLSSSSEHFEHSEPISSICPTAPRATSCPGDFAIANLLPPERQFGDSGKTFRDWTTRLDCGDVCVDGGSLTNLKFKHCRSILVYVICLIWPLIFTNDGESLTNLKFKYCYFILVSISFSFHHWYSLMVTNYSRFHSMGSWIMGLIG